MKNYFRFVVFALLGLLNAQWASAQNVTVSPTTGKLVAAATGGNEIGFQNGWSSVWRHEQLPLSFTVSDYDNLSAGGDVMVPAGNISVRNNQLVVMGGTHMDLYCVLALPKGYRFKKYKLVLLNNLNGVTVNSMRVGYNRNDGYGEFVNVSKVMYETDNTYGKAEDEDDNSVVSYNEKTETMGGATTDNSNTTEYVIERTSMTDDDMSNMLYFRLNRGANAFFGVTIKSFEVEFTAEGAFDAKVAPDEVGQAVSLVTAPFTTSKTDVGQLEQHTTTSGQKYYSYNYINTKDMEAYTYLYQQDAVSNGIPSDVATNKNITPVKVDGEFRYALGNDTYYIETPTHVKSQTGWNAPVGYRITGARFDYLWGSEVASGNKVVDACYITCTYNRRTYWLNGDLQFTRTRFAWTLDDDGNICNGNRYLACWGSSDQRNLTYSTDATSKYNLKRNSNGIYYISRSGTYYYLQYINYISGGYYNDWYYTLEEPLVVKTGTEYANANYRASSSTEAGASITYDGFSPGAYTLEIFDKTGTSVVKTITVNSASDADSYYLSGLNNDAVKFRISNLATGKQALVAVTLTMETLNPYINKMDIVAEDESKQLHLTQTFTANDFSVSGGAFKFYIPTDYAGEDITFSFRDLYSNDGDETYFDDKGKPGTGHARYSFVSSPYFETVDGNGDNGLYDSAYSPTTASTNKIYATNVGNIRFKFNNAENLSNTGGQSGTMTLEEYDFSVSNYLGSADPDNSTETGAFNQVVLNTNSPATKSDIAYLFTADETRYNIAPGSKKTVDGEEVSVPHAWEHRSYAFYRMDITLEAASYTPDLTWTKLYDHTCYADKDENNKDVDADKSMWGVKLGTLDENNKKVDGHLSAAEIAQAINAAFTSTGTNHPTSQDQILYVDGSDLTTIVSSSAITVEGLKAMLAPNCLFFLPKNMTSTADNIAYKTSSGSYNAARNIVLIDRKPFFSPYDIQVGAAPNYAKYTREITWQSQGSNKLATVILPFTIAVTEDGVHTEPDASPYPGCTFTVNKMTSDNCMSVDQAVDTEAKDFYATGYFTPITGVKEVDANKPYMIKVTTAPSDANVPFAVTQHGALVKATTDMIEDTGTADNPTPERYTFEGESATGKIVTSGISFQNYGSFSGKKLTASAGYFYFAGGKYLNSKNIRPEVSQYLYMYPFRGYYTYEGGGTGNAKMMLGFDVFFGENTTTGIADLTDEAVADLVAIPGRGSITFKASADNDVQIVKANGMAAGRVLISAGETKTINVPAGLYIVNGAKLIVK